MVDVWLLGLDLDETKVSRLWELLDPEERRQAVRFRTESLRRRFVVRRGALRQLLGRYTGRRPDRLLFRHGRYGKPRLASDAAGIHFNLSHSLDSALLAVTCDGPIGVDLEVSRPICDYGMIVVRNFSDAERETMSSLGESERLATFYRIWTRKEAFLKATGSGLSRPLDSFTVTDDHAGEPSHSIEFGDGHPSGRWFIADLPLPGSLIGALATKRAKVSVRTLRWLPEARSEPWGRGVRQILEAPGHER